MARRRSLAGSLAGALSGSLADRYASGGAAPFVGIIDAIVAAGDPVPGRALCDWGRLYSAYTGPILAVENVGTGLSVDIGYLADGTLDEDLIASWCGANVGRISTRYDQSGNALHHVQATATERPTIWNGAAILRDGVANRPAASYSRAALQSLGRAGYLSGAGAYTLCCGFRGTTVSYQVATTHSPLRFGVIGSNLIAYLSTGAPQRQFTAASAITTLGGYISTFAAGATIGGVPLEQNGTALAQASVANGTTAVNFATTDIRCGDESDGAAPALDGRVPWVLEWGSQLSAGALTLLRDFCADNI